MDAVLRSHFLFSSLLRSLHHFIFFLCVALEVFIFLLKCRPLLYLPPFSFVLLVSTLRFLLSKPSHVYLLDFSCLKPPTRLRVPTATLIEHLSLIGCFDEESVAFMSKIISLSGLGEETYFPPSLHQIPPSTHHQDCIHEAHMLLFPVLADLFSKTGVSPREVDVLVLNCSGLCPVPSLSAMLVNQFSMREDVRTFSLSGMGCSASAIGIDIARTLLRTRRGSYAVVVSTEILSTGWYNGTDRRKLVLNCLFRTGAAAVLLTNKCHARRKPKYKLLHLVRTQRAFDDKSYLSAIRDEDSEGITGFSIERSLLHVARELLRLHVPAVGALVLPFSERLKYVLKVILQWSEKAPAVDFRTAVRHYCMPGSGKGVIEETGRGLGLGPWEVEPALATFRRFGNQSSASMWYQLAYMEARQRVKKGDKVWQLAMGSGPKSNSVVWERWSAAGAEEEQEPQRGPCSDRVGCLY